VLCQVKIYRKYAARQTTLILPTSSRMNNDSAPPRSNSGIVNDLAIAVAEADTTPSTPTGVMKCCMFGVRRNGTVSFELMIG
jgi:hypothetical protein